MAPAGEGLDTDLQSQVLTGLSFTPAEASGPPSLPPSFSSRQRDSSLSSIYQRQKSKLNNLLEKYKQYICENVETVTQFEYWIKTLSYIIAGRISANHSAVFAELFYSSANLLIMFNDHILKKRLNLEAVEEGPAGQLKVFLTVVECVEVFIEIAASRYLPSFLKWILIFAVQLIKTLGRFILLFKHKTGLRCFPLVKRVNRKSLYTNEQPKSESQPPDHFTVLSSGRRIKSVRHTPQSSSSACDESCIHQPAQPTELNQEQLLAESLHNLQPMIYLFSLHMYGQKSWIPWLTSLASDVVSLIQLRRERFKCTREEYVELTRRRFILLLYLLRSPFYDRYSKVRIIRFLTSVSNRLPGAHYITDALKQYLPEWQGMYFYVWSS